MHYTNYLCIYIYIHTLAIIRIHFGKSVLAQPASARTCAVRRAAENAQADAWGCRRVDLGRINMLVKP